VRHLIYERINLFRDRQKLAQYRPRFTNPPPE
jgi:hypothetical protein